MKRPKLTEMVDLEQVRDLAEQMFERGDKVADVVDQITEVIDAVLKWPRGPVGAALEVGDGPVMRGIIRFVVAHVASRRGGA